MEKTKKDQVIDITSEALANLVGTTVGLLTAGPIGALGGAAIAPALAATIKDITKRTLSQNESDRIGTTFLRALDKIKERLEQGNSPRQDCFLEKRNGHKSHAATLLEGTLLKSRDEYEERKLVYYSNFWANIVFDNTIDFDRANVLLKIIERLSYRQLVILAYLSDGTVIKMDKWDTAFKDKPSLEKYFDLYSEITDLYDARLLKQAHPNRLKLGSADSTISPAGNTLVHLMELRSIPEQDRDLIGSKLDSIDEIIENRQSR